MSDLGKRFVGNTSWMLAQNIYSMVLSLVVGSLSARFLGPANYGLLGYGASLVNLFNTISALGLDAILINELVIKKEKSGELIGTTVLMRFFASVVSIILISIFVVVLEPENRMLHIVTFFQAISIVLQIHQVFKLWFQAELQAKYYVIASSIALTVSSAWRVALLYMKASVYWFALSTSIQAAVILVITYCIFKRTAKLKLTFSKDCAKYLISRGFHFIIANLAITIYTQMDKIMLGKILDESMVGLYTAAMNIAIMWEFIPTSIINSARPIVIATRRENPAEYIKREKLLLLALTILGACVGIGITVFGQLAMNILYGESYLCATPTLTILIWSTCFAMLGSGRSVWLIAEEMYAYQQYMVVMGAIINVVLNAVLIPTIGLNGAAISTLVAQLFVQFFAPLCFKKTRPFLKMYVMSFALLPELVNLVRENIRLRRS